MGGWEILFQCNQWNVQGQMYTIQINWCPIKFLAFILYFLFDISIDERVYEIGLKNQVDFPFHGTRFEVPWAHSSVRCFTEQAHSFKGTSHRDSGNQVNNAIYIASSIHGKCEFFFYLYPGGLTSVDTGNHFLSRNWRVSFRWNYNFLFFSHAV